MSPLLLVASAACEYTTPILLPIIHYDAGLLPFKSLNTRVDNILYFPDHPTCTLSSLLGGRVY